MDERKVVLITGAATGIGRATAELLARRGHRVFGTSRDPSRVGALEGIEMMALDVTERGSVEAGVREVLQRAGRVDALVNNVGYVLLGAAEETSFEEFAAQMDTNFAGAVRVTGAVLPSMREQGGGRIINMSSLGGMAALPYTAAYAASKFALEGYSEALRHELLPFGVYVSLVSPTNVRTETLASSNRSVAAPHPAYAEDRDRFVSAFKADGLESTVRPEDVAEVIARAIEHPRPRLRYPIGIQARLVPLVKVVLPQRAFEAAIRRSLKLDERGMPRGPEFMRRRAATRNGRAKRGSMPSIARRGQRMFTKAHSFIYRSSGGRAGRVFRGSPVLLLVTTGRKTGKRRTTPLMYLRDGDDMVVVASDGGAPKHPTWWLNLRANPEATVEVGRRELRVRAEEAGPEERGRLWPRLVALYANFEDYQRKTERQLPVVVLRPVGGEHRIVGLARS
jgi:deazaflavin-dependent oxidoreductase (nitroreductase family)